MRCETNLKKLAKHTGGNEYARREQPTKKKIPQNTKKPYMGRHKGPNDLPSSEKKDCPATIVQTERP